MPKSDAYGWYKREPKKFIRGVIGMGPDLIGAYAVILDLIYEDEDSCPNDPAWLAGILGCNARKARALIDGLVTRGKLHVNDRGRLVNEKATEVLDARKTVRRKAADNGETGGRRSGEVRGAGNENRDLFEADKKKNREEKNRKKDPAPKAQGRAVKASIPDDFPHPAAKAAAVLHWQKKGRPDLAAAVEDQAAQFRDHHAARGGKMLDWDAAWRTWIRNALEFTRPPRSAPAPVSAPTAADTATWVRRLVYFHEGHAGDEVEKGYWSPSWGPQPGQAGCLVPADALAAYAARRAA